MKHFGFPTKIFARKVTSTEHLAILVTLDDAVHAMFRRRSVITAGMTPRTQRA
jgi:hypothetical protein